MSLRQQFFNFDRILVETGAARPLSLWWREQVGRFLDDYEAGRSLEWWICAGRGSAKSYVLYKLAIFFSLYGNFDIPQSEMHYAVLLSCVKEEVKKGNLLVSRWFDALKIPHRATGDVVEIPSRRAGIRCVSSNVFAASGWRAFFVGADEYAKWGSDGASEYDADESLSSAKAMTATHPRAPFIVASTPWIAAGTFHEIITRGRDRIVVSGPTPTWEANPDSLSEEQSHLKEGSERRWKREYACEFVLEYEGSFFPPLSIELATDKGRLPGAIFPPSGQKGTSRLLYIIAIDPAFSGDYFGIVIAHAYYGQGGQVHVVVDHVSALIPPVGGTLSPDACVDHVVGLRAAWPDASCGVFSDQHEAHTLREAFAKRGVALRVEAWTQGSKASNFTIARNLLVDKRLRLPDDPELRREMSGIGISRTGKGNQSIESRSRHDDRVSAMVHAVVHAARNPSGEQLVSVGGQQIDASKMFCMPGLGIFGDYGTG